jgi:hypothetical protein
MRGICYNFSMKKTSTYALAKASGVLAVLFSLALPVLAFAQRMCVGNDCMDARPHEVVSTGVMVLMVIGYLALIALFVVALWKIFRKAGQPGWKAIVPVYNAVIACRIAGLSGWYVLLFPIPIVQIFAAIYLYYRLGKAFDKSTAFILGLIFLQPIFLVMLAFDKSAYKGPFYGTGAASDIGGTVKYEPTGASPAMDVPASPTPSVSTSAPESIPDETSVAPIDTTAESI